jgi:tRNA(Arg) A34 adenosine deaminase TadA
VTIRLASEARRAGDQPYGALLVAADGTVLAEDRNTVVTERDITAHPELKLARWAARELDPRLAQRLLNRYGPILARRWPGQVRLVL